MVGIDELNIASRHKEKLKKVGIDKIEYLVGIDEEILADILGCSVETAKKIIRQSWSVYKPAIYSADELLEMQEKEEKLETPLPTLNEYMGGGIAVGTLTEFYGLFGSGKTSMLMTQAVLTISKGYDVLWIDTEKTFNMKRFLEIAKNREVDENNIKEKFHFILAPSSNEIILLVSLHLTKYIKNFRESGHEIKALIVDSLTAPFRSDYSGISELAQRQQMLNKILRTLLRLAEINKFAVFFSNQVVSVPDTFEKYFPVGGNVVGHATTNIFKLRKSGRKRILTAVDVPFLPQIEIPFVINEKGVEEIEA